MEREDYYLVLGVSRSESPAGIRARYRDLVRTLHPDVAGPESTRAFQKVAEAYAVLADPRARRRHDLALATWQAGSPGHDVGDLAALRRDDPTALIAEPLAVRPSFDALVERLFRNFTGVGVPKTERPEPLTLEVILTPGEAARGVDVPIAVPRTEWCFECGGTGRVWLFPCVACGGQRMVVTERIVRVRVPPLTRPAWVGEISLDALGIHNLYLRLYARIA